MEHSSYIIYDFLYKCINGAASTALIVLVYTNFLICINVLRYTFVEV